jgi:chitin disaccharide deacetylase
MSSDKKIILCADDFGISPAVSKSICMLAEQNRISATSVMVVYEDWNIYCNALLNLKSHLDIGLHFVLTDSPPVSPKNNIVSIVNSDSNFYNMKQFMKRAWLGHVKKEDVLKELTAQYDKFFETFGVQPDFIDGHHNVHQYPIVDDTVIEFVKSRGIENKIYLRNTSYSLGSIFLQGIDCLKTAFISFQGSSFKKKLLNNGLRTNESFGGVYSLTRTNKFEDRIFEFCCSAGYKNGIIMLHPGKVDTILSERDSFCNGREIEEQVLLDQSFPKTLKSLNIGLDKFR